MLAWHIGSLMNNKNKAPAIDTALAHDPMHAEGAISPPIYQSSLFVFDNFDAMVTRYRGDSTQVVYSRVDNPTVSLLQDKLAELEGGEAARAFASGMAAISNTILGIVAPGDRIVCVQHVYPDTYRFLCGFCERIGIETQFVDGRDTDAIIEALPGARLLYLESPNSWMMQEQRIAEVAAAAKTHGALTIADNSWATPLFQNPIKHGVDVVVHSASKYLSGHSDVVAGVVIGAQSLIDQVDTLVRPYLGGCLSPQNASLILRGLRTLSVRMQRHAATGLELARRLSQHPDVTAVHHPGLAPETGSTLSGYGSLFSIELDSAVDIREFCNALDLFRLGVSWGGYESLVVPAIVGRNQAGLHNSAVDFDVPERTVRLYAGLEDVEDLWQDLSNAIKLAS
jgi:cystathionine beta-lyase/cystathionine gamma-synthase